jgi:hypothetical protein
MEAFSDPQAVARYAEGPPRLVPGFSDLQRMIAVLLAERAPDDARVLVLGAGGGLEIKAFSEARPDWRFDGIDPSAEMLNLARSTLGPLATRTRLHHGLIDCAPEGPFDAATCILTLHFVEREERLRTLKEVQRSFRLFILESLVSEDGDAAALSATRDLARSPPVRADRDASKTTVSAALLPRRRIRDNAPRTIAETTATDERGVNPSLASPRRPTSKSGRAAKRSLFLDKQRQRFGREHAAGDLDRCERRGLRHGFAGDHDLANSLLKLLDRRGVDDTPESAPDDRAHAHRAGLA